MIRRKLVSGVVLLLLVVAGLFTFRSCPLLRHRHSPTQAQATVSTVTSSRPALPTFSSVTSSTTQPQARVSTVTSSRPVPTFSSVTSSTILPGTSALPESPDDNLPGYHPRDPSLLSPSSSEPMTFFMYRIQNDYDYDPENQNMASLGGALWYLHNEIVNNQYRRRFDKTRIQRFKVTVQAPQPLIDLGMNFGTRFAYDLGQCTGPWDFEAAYAKFGYFVGCNYVDQFPTPQWRGKVFYADAIWYSLPGKCGSRKFNNHTEACELAEPGGACDNVTGRGDCTYSYEDAGEISIDELEGIESFTEFAKHGGWEYNNHTDRGVHMTFWNNKNDTGACDARMRSARELFALKYPQFQNVSELPATGCDYNKWAFYHSLNR